ncbi:hypothetical protein niasHT_038857 [Heterodera trifolii]|uniref:Uncharacterized protein n=1 Tax=Heterodera trifolii TaxID=157864 RepID=A0ABD2IRG1_9BILA
MVTHHFWHWYTESQFLCKKQRTNGWEIGAGGAAANGRTTIDGFALLAEAPPKIGLLKKPLVHNSQSGNGLETEAERSDNFYMEPRIWLETDKADPKPTNWQNKSGKNFFDPKKRQAADVAITNRQLFFCPS